MTLVDCPGHATLIRTVMCGARIIDIVLLIVDVTKGFRFPSQLMLPALGPFCTHGSIALPLRSCLQNLMLATDSTDRAPIAV